MNFKVLVYTVKSKYIPFIACYSLSQIERNVVHGFITKTLQVVLRINKGVPGEKP